MFPLKFGAEVGGAENAGHENDRREIDGPICRAERKEVIVYKITQALDSRNPCIGYTTQPVNAV